MGGGFIRNNLMPGERLVGAARVHPLSVLLPALAAGIGFAVFAACLALGLNMAAFVGICVFAVAAPTAAIRTVSQVSTEYGCTDRRVVSKSGLLSTVVREMPLAKIESLRVEQSLVGRLLGYGSVVFRGSGGTDRVFRFIDGPFEFYRDVQEQVAVAQGSP